MLMNTGNKPVHPENGLLSTIAWQINNQVTYALEGSVFTAGAALKWLRDSMGLFQTNEQIATLVDSVDDNGGVYFVPAFTGLGAPWWDAHARGALFGLTAGTQPGHVIRATLEAMAFQTRDVFDQMQAVSGIGLKTLRVDGGASASDLLMQFQSDLIGLSVERPSNRETTVTGAAMLAGIAAGLWKNPEDAICTRQIDKVFNPSISINTRNDLYQKWSQAVAATRAFRP
jgi:glycerol kinase